MAIKDRSKRFGIVIRKDGNRKSPNKNIASSRFGDPVNFFYQAVDKASALAAKAKFLTEKAIYAELDESMRSADIITGRINRLLRLFGAPPIQPATTFSLDDPSVSLTRQIPVVNLSLADDGDILIPAARIAVLWHPWWGALHLDDDLFDGFVDNWQTGVIQRELSVDIDHRRSAAGSASLAWVNDVYLKGPTFFMRGEPTNLGRELLGGQFKYASIEYALDYRSPEDRISFGPTLLGVAATNIPFVRGNPPMGFIPAETPANTESLSVRKRKYFNPSRKEKLMPEGTIVIADREYTRDEITNLMASHVQLQDSLKSGRLSAATGEALRRGVAPALVSFVEQVMEATDPAAPPTINVERPTAEENGTEAEETTLNMFGAMETLLSIAPGRIESASDDDTDLDESGQRPAKRSNPYFQTNGEDEDMTPEDAEALAIKRRQELGIKDGDHDAS